jgi:hypothetical protein
MAMFDPPRRRFPWLRVGFLALVAVTVVAVIVNPRLLDGARGAWEQGRTLIDEVTAEPRVTGAAAVSAHDYVPLRAAAAGRAGANVRDYPLLSGDLVVNLPAAAPLLDIIKVFDYRVADNFGCRVRIAMRGSQRFRQYGVDQAKLVQALRGDAHGFRRILRFVRTLPQDRCTALG